MDAVESCPHRRDVSVAGSQESATCGLLAAAFGSDESRFVRVDRAACDVCSRIESPADARTNPIIASLIYSRADDRLREEPTGPDAARFLRLKDDASHRLPGPLGPINHAAGALGILTTGERRLTVQPVARGRPLTWAVAVLTAPRRPPTLAATLASLREAGFADALVFAEPGADIPAEWAGPVTRHDRPLGQIRNFAVAARGLLARSPAADCYAIFADDISVARGLRRWCDSHLWPAGQGVVSLYTSRIYADDRPGWQTLNLGLFRTCGAMAFVFRKELLREFVSDAGVARHVEQEWPAVDALVGEWALGRGIGIAHHTPSLIQHEGGTTSVSGRAIDRAEAAASVEEIAGWRPAPKRAGKVGLIGWNTPSGLGYQNRDIARYLPVDRWLAPRHSHYRRLWRPRMPGKYHAPWSRTVSEGDLRPWLFGLDWLLFVELPYRPEIVALARDMGVRLACVPNWEWLAPGLDWVPHVDLMICPTAHTYQMLRRWRRALGLAADLAHVPWPIDADRFRFRRRERCRRFLFVNGTAGVTGRRADGSPAQYTRKGVGLVAETARLLPHIPFLFYSQVDGLPKLPANVEVRRGPAGNTRLYDEGDVCVQPSHWEGLGLQLLECQAAGMPLVTTDAPPMNECRPFRTVRVAETETVFLIGGEPVESQLVRPEDLAAVLESIYDTDVRDASEQARAYIERERSWSRARDVIAALMPA
jgi:glycosyltransferase involved in cell wall biosynthesis